MQIQGSKLTSIYVLAGLCLGIPTRALGSEVDNFASWDQRNDLANARPIIEENTKKFWNEAMAEAGSLESCDEKLLYRALRARFGNHVGAEFGKLLYADHGMDLRVVDRSDSIYGDFGLSDSLVLSTFMEKMKLAQALNIAMGGVLRYDEFYFGTDKLEHLWATGWSYFKKNYFSKNGSLEKAFEYGEGLESGILGLGTTGVYSFGDLSANFNGMRFWNHVLLKQDDILGAPYNLGPYVECRDKHWVSKEIPDWSNYIDASWSEANNCSKFRNETTVAKVNERLAAMTSAGESPRTCPMEPQKMEKLKVKYSPASNPQIVDRVLNLEFGFFEEEKVETHRERLRESPRNRVLGGRGRQ